MQQSPMFVDLNITYLIQFLLQIWLENMFFHKDRKNFIWSMYASGLSDFTNTILCWIVQAVSLPVTDVTLCNPRRGGIIWILQSGTRDVRCFEISKSMGFAINVLTSLLSSMHAFVKLIHLMGFQCQ